MGRVEREWLKDRRNWTRDEQKKRVMQWFKTRSEKGVFDRATAQKISNGLHMISAQGIKEICDEMVKERVLDVKTVVHRTRKDGSTIEKSLYIPYSVDEWRDAWLDREYLKAKGQMSMFDFELTSEIRESE